MSGHDEPTGSLPAHDDASPQGSAVQYQQVTATLPTAGEPKQPEGGEQAPTLQRDGASSHLTPAQPVAGADGLLGLVAAEAAAAWKPWYRRLSVRVAASVAVVAASSDWAGVPMPWWALTGSRSRARLQDRVSRAALVAAARVALVAWAARGPEPRGSRGRTDLDRLGGPRLTRARRALTRRTRAMRVDHQVAAESFRMRALAPPPTLRPGPGSWGPARTLSESA